MFEKEAKEYLYDRLDPQAIDSVSEFSNEHIEEAIVSSFKKGAEFGYNKANEWHYVKDRDLPNKELKEKQLLVRVRNYTEDYILAYYMLDKYYSKNGKRFYFDIDCDYPINTKDVIAWKEIELPKEEMENESHT